MRGSGWILPALALLLWIAVVAAPLAGLGLALGPPEAGASVAVDTAPARPAGRLLLETSAYALVIALGAMLCGWAPGRVLGRAVRARRFVPLAALVLFPICLPAYVVFYTWWLAWPAPSPLHDWAVARDLLPALRAATLVLGLVCWSWPIVAWCVAGGVASTPRSRGEMLALDGAGPGRRLLDLARTDGRGLAIGGLLVAVVAFDNTTCFDLAQIFTYGNELRAQDALGASPREVLVTALPAMAIAAVGGVIVWTLLATAPRRAAMSLGRGTALARVTAGAVWIGSVLVPLVLLLVALDVSGRGREFLVLYGRDALGSVRLAAVSGAVAAVVAIGLAMAWCDHRPWVRRLAHVQAAGWLVTALLPGTVVGVGIEAAYNLPGLADAVYRRPAVLVLAHLARFGVVAALLGRAAAAATPRALDDLRRLDGAETLRGFLGATRPQALGAAVASFAVVLALGLGEVPVTARVHPPGSNPLVMIVLNDMHYQRPQTVIIAVLLLMVVAALAASTAALVCAPRPRRRWRGGALVLGALVAATGATGCAGLGAADDDEPRPLRPKATFGRNGTSLGHFSYPRDIAADPEREVLYIVDKTARVQRFGFDGEPQLQWRMPAWENGKPTGLSVAPDGRVFVADTHYYRIIAYDPDGNEVMRFGTYGQGPGEFIYPTDVAFGPDGTLYVAEYGGHDRIQVFSPEGDYLFEFGSFGSGPGELSRPQSIVFDATGAELYIADACNHRIVVTDPRGRVLRTFGTPGTGPGQLNYPYGLMLLDDGSLLVSEFGNNRIQHLSADGASRGRFGRFGAGEGELRYPWGVAGAGSSVFVLDSGNNRVHRIRRP
jgi:DNA-binding beta-propeller fold protein YncE/ABC-type Fe3+ transport system permease subunit